MYVLTFIDMYFVQDEKAEAARSNAAFHKHRGFVYKAQDKSWLTWEFAAMPSTATASMAMMFTNCSG